MRMFILDDHDQAVEVHGVAEWAAWMDANITRQSVAHTVVNAEHRIAVSTIFLGQDVSLFGEPQIYETALFRDGEFEGNLRYETRKEALAGHEKIVEHAKEIGMTNLEEFIQQAEAALPKASWKTIDAPPIDDARAWEGEVEGWRFLVVSFSIAKQGFPAGTRGADGTFRKGLQIFHMERAMAERAVQFAEKQPAPSTS